MSATWSRHAPSVFETSSSRASKLSNYSVSSSSKMSDTLSLRSSNFSMANDDDMLPHSVPSPELILDGDEDWRAYLTAKLFTKPLENRFLCAKCMRVLQHPVSLSECDHHVCSGCLGDICRNKTHICPIDKKRFNRHECITDETLEKQLNKLELGCPHKRCGCNWIGLLENYKDHYEACSHTEVTCPNGCNHRTTKRLLEDHINIDCPLRTIACDFCKRDLSAQSEIEHLKDCPKLPIDCPKSCGKVNIPRDLMSVHLNSECVLAEFSCPYEHLGCDFKGSKSALVEHVQAFMNEHIKMLCDGVIKHGKLLSQQDERLKQHTETINDHREKLAILNRENETQLLWKIDNWSVKTAEAKSGKRPILHSVPFYTGKHQYKLALTLFPNGDKAVKGRFMSLYVRICKGDYDTLLHWPFSLEIDLIVIDQSQDPRGRSDFTHCIRPNTCKDNLPFLGKPIAETNPAFGIQSFASLDLLGTRDYVRDDVMFIRACVKRKNFSKKIS